MWRYHVLYVYERGYESNGAMWFSVVELMVWSLLIAQSFTSCVLFSKAAWTPGIVLYITVPYYLYRYIGSIKAGPCTHSHIYMLYLRRINRDKRVF